MPAERASTAPATISSGPWSPPSASTATRIGPIGRRVYDSYGVGVRRGSISRPRYVLQFGHISCDRFGWRQCGQTLRRGAGTACWARRLSRRALDVFRFGTAMRPGSIAARASRPVLAVSGGAAVCQ